MPKELQLITAFTVGLVILVSWLIISSLSESNRLIKQCIDDGKKEYECRAILNGGRHYTPILIPAGR